MRKHIKKSVLIATLVVMLLALTVPVASASGGIYHKVYYGETLFSIGRHYGVNPYAIAHVNHLDNPNHIYAGQVLYIPTYKAYDGCSYRCDGYDSGGYGHKGDYGHGYKDDYGYGHKVDYGRGYKDDYGYGHKLPSSHHVVARGETLTSIAYYYGLSPWLIAKANRIYNLHRIYAGEVLYIPRAKVGYQSY